MKDFMFGEIPYGYRMAAERHIKLIALAMAESFALAKYPIPVQELDYDILLKLKYETFKYIIKNALEKGVVIYEDNFIANIVLVPYEDACNTPYKELVNIIRNAGFNDVADNYIKTVEHIAELKKSIKLKEKTMYIEIFSVETQIQGNGFGKRLMKQIMNKCKKNGYDLFLYTNTLKNEAIYNHFGFKTLFADGDEKTGYTVFMLAEAEETERLVF